MVSNRSREPSSNRRRRGSWSISLRDPSPSLSRFSAPIRSRTSISSSSGSLSGPAMSAKMSRRCCRRLPSPRYSISISATASARLASSDCLAMASRITSLRSGAVVSCESMIVANSSLSISPSSLASASPRFISSSSSVKPTLSPTVFAAAATSSRTMNPFLAKSKQSKPTSSESSRVTSAMRSVTLLMNSPRSTLPPPSSSRASNIALSSLWSGSKPSARAADFSSFSSMSPPWSASTKWKASVSSLTSSAFMP
mmetsp:Transcript_779/g.3017  ORF Transcript_779/g.3017 Transcript_779/m.3017 type:complete len:255 (+) Transcript_779:478-1242(+)